MKTLYFHAPHARGLRGAARLNGGAEVAVAEYHGGIPDVVVNPTAGRFTVAGTGDVSWQFAEPAEYAGTYATDQSEEYQGALSIGYTEATAPQCIFKGSIRRVIGPVDEAGATYRHIEDMWQIDDDDAPTYARQWFLNGVPTGVPANEDYTPTAAGTVQVRSTCTITGKAVRSCRSNVITVTAAYTGNRTDFTAADGTLIQNHDDRSGFLWTLTKSASVNLYSGMARGAYGTSGRYFATRSDPVGANQWAEIGIQLPATGHVSNDFIGTGGGVAVRVDPTHSTIGGSASRRGYIGSFSKNGTTGFNVSISRVNFGENAAGNSTTIAATITLPAADFALGSVVKLRLSVKGNVLTLSVNGTVVLTGTDTDAANALTSGLPGLWFQSAGLATNATPQGITSFEVGVPA